MLSEKQAIGLLMDIGKIKYESAKVIARMKCNLLTSELKISMYINNMKKYKGGYKNV